MLKNIWDTSVEVEESNYYWKEKPKVNLGKTNKSNHLFDPFTSIPRKGTKSKLRNATKNKITESFVKIF